MEELKQYLSGVAIGVRFRNNYSIEDYLGSIADVLLFSKNNGLLNYVTFPYQSKSIDSTQLSLHNQSTGDNLTINMNNIVLDLNFSEKIPKEKSSDVIDEYFKALTQKIYKIVNIQDIQRVGLVYKYIINDEPSVKSIKKYFSEMTFDDASTVTLNFSKKIILSDSKLKKDHNDYENVICTLSIAHDKKNEYFFQVDYQHIYDPRLDSVIDIPYKDFVDKAAYYNTDTISKWIKKYE